MYCVNCGVKLGDAERTCPLCGVAAYHPDIPHGKGETLYPQQKLPVYAVAPRTAQIVVSTGFLLAILITLLCDLQFDGNVSWSGYVTGALVTAYVVFVLPYWFRKPNPVVFSACDFAVIGLYLLYINFAVDGDWFLSFAFPVTGAVGAIVVTVVTLLRYIRRGALYVIGGAMAALGAFMPLMEFLLHITFQLRFTGWSLYPLTALVLLGGMLIFLAINRRVREKMERRFFL